MTAVTFELLKLLGAVAAILALAWAASRMGLGGDRRIRTEDDARALAEEAICGFEPVDMAIDRAGIGALLRDAQGRILLLRRHGAHFAARLLDSHAFARLDRELLTIGTDERRFGRVTLDLGPKAQVWAAGLRHLQG